MARRPKKRQKSDNSKNNNEGTYHLIASFLVSGEVEGSQVNSLKTSKASIKSTIGPAVPKSLALAKKSYYFKGFNIIAILRQFLQFQGRFNILF